jgi:hypothetical protein
MVIKKVISHYTSRNIILEGEDKGFIVSSPATPSDKGSRMELALDFSLLNRNNQGDFLG